MTVKRRLYSVQIICNTCFKNTDLTLIGKPWSHIIINTSSLTFPYLGLAHQVFILHFLRSCASSSCSHVFLITSLTSVLVFLSFGLRSLPCSHYYNFPCLSTHTNHLSLASLILSLMFATPAPAYFFFSFILFPLLCGVDVR